MSENKLRKVFVGGLGWETEKETLREHFSQFGDIVEAVIISDKFSGRSKGYGFITFTNSTSAIKACQNPTPFINGRRVNCNLAFLRSRRLPSSSSPPPPPPPPPPPLQGGGRKVVAKGTSWYCYAPGPYNHFTAGGMTAFYVAAAAAAPAYGYSPSCISNYGYPQGQYSCQGTVLAPNAILHMYPVYHFQHHQPQVVGIPAQFFSPASASASICGFTATFPVIISDPLAVSPTNVEAVKGCS